MKLCILIWKRPQNVALTILGFHSIVAVQSLSHVQLFATLWAAARQAEKTLESPLDCKEIQPVNPKGNKSWIFIGRTDAEAEIPIFWPPDVKNWLFGKDSDAGKDWRWEEKGTTED